ncbi:MAG: GGDEF-domain containing protein, partial [Methylococcaceae bacterium]|nr:GGDEF-domain containing protein [Methylococcaceae bacterium]
MSSSSFCLSLRWKLAILFGSVFLLMHSFFSYFAFLHATEDYQVNRSNEHSKHILIARALTEDSFLVLEQLAEMFPLLGEYNNPAKNRQPASFPMLDEKWSQWQLSWSIENMVFFDSKGAQVKS